MAKHRPTDLFLCLPFLKYSIFFLVRRNFFERVYIHIKVHYNKDMVHKYMVKNIK